ncbi:MAG TPA: GNAT family N-acetyltransferase [Thermomicrobiales bacterium]|nr:GNAT family N-acetyltransferase [Thermomicrobiales bacterium]
MRLVALSPDDAGAYYALVDRNRGHLTQHGDYAELGRATPASVIEDLRDPQGGNARFGIWLGDTLIGRADLSPRMPGHFVIGYWLGSEYTGRSYATRACAALIRHGRDTLGATAIFAGVTKGNAASEALLSHLGFCAIDDRGTYTLFKLPLT